MRSMTAFAYVRSSGQRVVIDGPCASACTFVLSIVPQDKVCATPRAQFEFHAAWDPDGNGRTKRNSLATEFLMKTYPARVQAFIRKKGGLTEKMIRARATDLGVPKCR